MSSEKSGAIVASKEKVYDLNKLPNNAEFPVVCIDEYPKQLIEEGTHSIAM